jgi:hypothetical protein
MNKVFSCNGIEICREDYESMPCAMKASEFSDKEMQSLIDNIACVMAGVYGYTEHEIQNLDERGKDKFNEIFWREMEWCAVNMGMRYYEDDNFRIITQ